MVTSRHIRFRRRITATLIWTVASITAVDLLIGLCFRPPADPRLTMNSVARYFDYGRSTEGKLRRLVGSTPQQAAPIMKAGWLSRTCDSPSRLIPNKLNFDIYGMSFSDRIADELELINPAVAGTRFGGPAAPLSHSYACFVRRNQAGRNLAPVQILSILQSSIPRMVTISGLTTSFEGPEPFSYPRYFLTHDGHISARESNIESEDDLRMALADRGKWEAFLDELEDSDFLFSRYVFQEDVFDASVVGRMLRRALGQRVQASRFKRLQLNEQTGEEPDIAPVVRALIVDFARRTRASDKTPLVILIEDQGSEQNLEEIATSSLISNKIRYINTSSVASPNDAANFVSDGHFTTTANRRVAQAVLELLRAE